MADAAVPEAVVVVTGPFEGAAVETWRRLIADAVAARPGRLVVDLAKCVRLDAAAIVVLLDAHRDMLRSDGRLTLRSPSARVRRTLSLARADGVFDIENVGLSTAAPE
ncbi:STAS domain-containing protein [Paractinoplanes rishiriensis]|uniref:STAS domain-containing protein n=1 Tax=Paractinoplanes rishiriensis TaxID=1050105 RepID=A0A919MZH2_9ACTN|nr:STAS domain-containing protein [Actinoplanes rishiriensis]GIF01245.1 hypothetical protein Ari01nite_87090 [Actinoplanes rishiriensis]